MLFGLGEVSVAVLSSRKTKRERKLERFVFLTIKTSRQAALRFSPFRIFSGERISTGLVNTFLLFISLHLTHSRPLPVFPDRRNTNYSPAAVSKSATSSNLLRRNEASRIGFRIHSNSQRGAFL